mmetsp:Transcript_12061/g.34123  ORF Transcript_12061/g.34123 Transcript_12061/m.34123 type:complete len:234 (+) Transcript_12061:3274-3975(+)
MRLTLLDDRMSKCHTLHDKLEVIQARHRVGALRQLLAVPQQRRLVPLELGRRHPMLLQPANLLDSHLDGAPPVLRLRGNGERRHRTALPATVAVVELNPNERRVSCHISCIDPKLHDAEHHPHHERPLQVIQGLHRLDGQLAEDGQLEQLQQSVPKHTDGRLKPGLDHWLASPLVVHRRPDQTGRGEVGSLQQQPRIGLPQVHPAFFRVPSAAVPVCLSLSLFLFLCSTAGFD